MKKKYTLFIILIILLNINSCFRWGNITEPTWYDISENFDSIDKNKIKQIENAQSEINIDERTYTFSCIVSRSPDYRSPKKRWFSINIYEISTESLSSNSSYNIHFIQDFDIVEFYMINRAKKFYFSSKEIATRLVSYNNLIFSIDIKKMNIKKIKMTFLL